MKIKYYKSLIQILIVGIGIVQTTGCKKLVEADLPIDKITAKAVFSDVGGASAALSNIYYIFPRISMIRNSVNNGLTSDELVLRNLTDQNYLPFYTNSLSSKTLDDTWAIYYDLIFRVNSIIEGVEASVGIPNSSKKELIGQAKFFRAFAYFYLVNLYGGVPIITSTDYKTNMLLPRSKEGDVYGQIVKDLVEAQNLVNENYLKPDMVSLNMERVTVNKAAATALLARVYLYVGQWKNAELEAGKVISNPKYTILTELNKVFLMNSDEAILQIEGDISKGENSEDGNFLIPDSPEGLPTVYLSDNILEEISIDDKRRQKWLNSVVKGATAFFYPFKYKMRHAPSIGGMVTTEYNMILRLAEQYLIRAEARAHLDNMDGSIADLNVIRNRAGLSSYTSLSEKALLLAIEKERQVEFFSEGGHRWFDLKRTGRADVVLAPLKGNNWQPTDKLYPIPASEFGLNPSLRGHQNPGYSE